MKDLSAAELRRLTGLRSLDLTRNAITGVGLRRLSGLRQLRSLVLDRTKVSSKGLKALVRLPGLRSLSLRFLDLEKAPSIGALESLVELRVLDLTYTSLRDTALTPLRKLGKLRKLLLANVFLKGPGLKHLRLLSRLEWLDLSSQRAPKDLRVRELKHLARMKRLRVLALGGNNLPLVRTMPIVGKLVDLRSLDLAGVAGAGNGLPLLRHLSRLRVLVLSHTSVKNYYLRYVGRMTSLRVLSLETALDLLKAGIRNHLTGAALVHVKRLVELRSLNLRHNLKVGDSGLRHLRGLVRLRSLNLYWSGVCGTGLRWLPSSLRALDLSMTQVTDRGSLYLTNLTKLQDLDLRKTRVTAAGVKALEKKLSGTTIRR